MRLAKSKKGLLPEDLIEFQNRVEKLEKLMENLETERQKYKKKLEAKIVEQETFLLFLNNSHQYYKYATYVQKRGLIEKLVSNIQINPDSSLKIEMKPGLDSLIICDGNATEN
jgi:predicted RNA-binding protein with EMAP domain